MNTNHLKKFAQEARRKLLEQVGAKLNFVLTTDSAELREKTEQLKQLRQELGSTKKEQLIEKVAYTWFNRLMALRFMDVNDYQPFGIRIITPKEGYTTPEVLDEAKRGNIHEELKVNRQRIYDLLDNKIPSTNPQNEAFKELLIAACNYLNTTFPFLFEKINDYTELLLPDDLTSDFSIVKNIRNGMLIEDCKNVEIIGWLYQFYISEKKDEVFATKSKVKKDDIPAATQLFTPRWIVEYMVQNSLGKLWLLNHPKSRLIEHMQYYIESASKDSQDYIKISSPEEIRLADIACGSGHILVYAFDLFTKIYEEEGYNISEIPYHIIEKNLFGCEIDERAAQLAGFALMMKAREYQRRVFNKNSKPNILCFQELQIQVSEIENVLSQINLSISDALKYDLQQMQEASNYGSLIIPQAEINEIISVLDGLNRSTQTADIFLRKKVDSLINSLKQLLNLSEKFHCVVTNPPYMGFSKMNNSLSNMVRIEYSSSKADLMTCFMERCNSLLLKYGHYSMINLPSWMFLSSFEEFRKKFLTTNSIDSFLHLGRGIFGADFGSVAFTCVKTENINTTGIYRRLFKEHVQVRNVDKIKELFLDNDYGRYLTVQKDLMNITGCPIAYWASKRVREIFKTSKTLSDFADSFQGIITGNNEKLLRYWFEVSRKNIGFGLKSVNEVDTNNEYWIPYNKGGKFRKWYGNQEYVVNWSRRGINFTRGKNSFSEYFFREYLSWTYLSASTLATRYYPNGFIWDVAGSGAFPHEKDDIYYLLSVISSNVGLSLLSIINPTINFQVENLLVLPIIYPANKENRNEVDKCVKSNILISKEDWDNNEISWDFSTSPLLKHEDVDSIVDALDYYKQFWKLRFEELLKNEEKINQIIIETYGLSDEISNKINPEDITILEGVSKCINGRIEFLDKKLIEDFISYSVGCCFGRFALLKKDSFFSKDDDYIIPILEDEWFEDDIVGRFKEFLRETFGERIFNRNLAFVEEQIGKDIRKYFIKDFYSEHVKRYQKRPIYWMFSSPNDSFNVLIYMHCYTPDTVSNILNNYLKEFIGKLNTRKEHLERVKETGSSSDKSKAIKESDYIQKMLVELHEYERDILYPLATERIEIDLDDGVLVNYNKFGKAVKEVNGLNDPVTKKKVKQFDWIDSTQIR